MPVQVHPKMTAVTSQWANRSQQEGRTFSWIWTALHATSLPMGAYGSWETKGLPVRRSSGGAFWWGMGLTAVWGTTGMRRMSWRTM